MLVSKCSNLSSIDGLNTGTLQNVKNSFNYSGIEKLLIISKLRLTLEDSFNNSRITKARFDCNQFCATEV